MDDSTAALTCDAWVATSLGDPTSVLQRQQVEVPAPGTNEARITVEAFCLNFNDVDGVRGRYRTVRPPTPLHARHGGARRRRGRRRRRRGVGRKAGSGGADRPRSADTRS